MSCIPLSVAKTHRLKVKPVDTDEPSMRTFDGSDLNIVGQTHLYLKIKTYKGFTTKKLLHALVIDYSHDREILISWDNCLAFGIIPKKFPILDLETDSDEDEDADHNHDEPDNSDNSESDSD